MTSLDAIFTSVDLPARCLFLLTRLKREGNLEYISVVIIMYQKAGSNIVGIGNHSRSGTLGAQLTLRLSRSVP